MDPDTTQVAIEMGKSVAVSAAKAASGAIWHKVQLAKEKKDLQEARQAYESIINELSQDNTDLVSTAQAYRSQLERIEISDEDIESLHSTVNEVLNILKEFTVIDDDAMNSFEQFKKLLTTDTLRTLQLLGFNYREAIGDPLTQICKEAILKWGGNDKPQQKRNSSQRRK